MVLKLKVFLMTMIGLIGLGSSIALADGGRHGDRSATKAPCSHAALSGTLAPQTFTVTVQRASHNSGFTANQVVTVSVGGSGDTVRLVGEGCANGSTFTARGVVLQVWNGRGHDGGGRHEGGGTTTTTTTTTTDTTTTAATTTTPGL